jgi:GT2 family glycosyltransferase
MIGKAILTESPLVSVCIPLYNGERYIKESLQSVLDQSYPSLEILVSDHSSTDSSAEIVESFDDPRIRFSTLSEGHTAADNWNASTANARGTYIKLLCQDDLLKPDCVKLQVEAMERNTGAVFCFSPRDVISPRGRVLLKNRSSFSGPEIVNRADFLPLLVRAGTNIFGEPCAVLMTREAMAKAGPFTGSYLIDLEMWNRLWRLGPAVFVDECISQFRIGNQTWTSKLKDLQSHQMNEFLANVVKQDPKVVTGTDLRIGAQKSKKLAFQRSILISLVELFRI